MVFGGRVRMLRRAPGSLSCIGLEGLSDPSALSLQACCSDPPTHPQLVGMEPDLHGSQVGAESGEVGARVLPTQPYRHRHDPKPPPGLEHRHTAAAPVSMRSSAKARRLRSGATGTVLGLLSLLMAGCGSGNRPESLCPTVVPALRHSNQVVDQIAAFAQHRSPNSVPNSQLEQTFAMLEQAFTKASSEVPPERRASFQGEAAVLRQIETLAHQSTGPDDQFLNQIGQVEQPHAAEVNANTAYIYQRCGGRSGVYGPTTAPGSS